MNLNTVETWVQWLGGVFALVVLVVVFVGIYRGARRPVGTTAGSAPRVLHSRLFYFAASILYFGVCYLFWRPLPLALSPAWRAVALVLGGLLYFSGMAFTLWARLTLGRMYFVSTGFGAQLFADHQLITRGPFAIVRHPMYLGISLAAVGGLLLYQTWTMVLMLILPLGLTVRARREEQALAAKFGEQWQDYCRRVPGWIPRLRRS